MLPPEDELTSDAIAGEYRILQRRGGHRYSVDDVLTAYVATRACPSAPRALDLGTGIGSVLLMTAFRLPEAKLVGVEAQEVSFAMLRENVARNGLSPRVRTLHGDLRDPAVRRDAGGPFPLITGTPPYFPPGTASLSPDPQRAHARVELRGGVEAYIEAAAELLEEDGTFVMCAAAPATPRVEAFAPTAGLHIHARLDGIPRRGRPPLFTVFTLRRAPVAEAELGTYTAREEDGARTEESFLVREHFGLVERELRP